MTLISISWVGFKIYVSKVFFCKKGVACKTKNVLPPLSEVKLMKIAVLDIGYVILDIAYCPFHKFFVFDYTVGASARC